MIFTVAKQSLLDRKTSVLLTFIALFVSVCLLVTIEHVRKEAKESFYRTVSGVDLIVGARTGQINLLLSSVFRVGANANSVSWDSYQRITSSPQVKWSIPLSLGDSHRGFAVIGTTNQYFEYYRFGDKRSLSFASGKQFGEGANTTFDMVIGAEVAQQLNYKIGSQVVISHGVGDVSFSHHDDHPFTVVGILDTTGTPVDQAIHIKLSAVEAVHSSGGHSHATAPIGKSIGKSQAVQKHDEHSHDEHSHDEHSHDEHSHDEHSHDEHSHDEHSHDEHGHDEHSHEKQGHHEDPYAHLEPTQISAFMLGLQSRIAVLQVQRQVNQDKQEPLSAIIPGVALAELWRLVGAVENVLRVISVAVLIASLLGLSTMLLASMRERKPELAVMRVMGAKPSFVFWLIQIEALSIALIACLSAILAIFVGLWLGSDWMLANYGLSLSSDIFSVHTALVVCVVMLATFLLALAPSISAYRAARLV